MPHRTRHISGPARRPRRLPGAGPTAAGLLACGLLTTACGGSPAGPSQPAPTAQGLAYATCMRAHGATNFPDPVQGANGHVSLSITDPNSPQVKSAMQACRSLDPGGGAPPQPLTAAQQQAYLRWAACIRAHGVPSFPDPAFPSGQVQINIPADAKANGTLQRAAPACAHVVPGGSPIGFRHGS